MRLRSVCLGLLIVALAFAHARAGDLATAADGRTPAAILADPLLGPIFHRIMGPRAFAIARRYANTGTAAPATEAHGVALATACPPRQCSANEVVLALDHEGNAWASLVQGGVPTYFGNPDPYVRAMMDQLTEL